MPPTGCFEMEFHELPGICAVQVFKPTLQGMQSAPDSDAICKIHGGTYQTQVRCYLMEQERAEHYGVRKHNDPLLLC